MAEHGNDVSMPMNRRRFLGSAGLTLGATALAACGGGGGGGGGNSGKPNTTAVAPPAYKAYTAAQPAFPAGDHGIPAAYYSYPANPPTFVTSPPGSGGTVSFMCEADHVMTPVASNRWMQGLNKATNVNLKLSTTPGVDYPQKLQVTVAGGDLADVVQIVSIPDQQQVLTKGFTDLSDYLTGKNILSYPGFASMPPEVWKTCMINGRIWGIPQPRPPAGRIASTRGDTLKKFGIGTNSPTVSSGADFTSLCKSLTDVKRGKYAIGEQPSTWVLMAMLEMLGAPNNWKVANGTFTSVVETDEMKAALEQVTKLWKAGYIHPDSFSNPGANFTWWSGGITSIYFQSISGWPRYAQLYPNWDMGVITLPKWNGGGPANKILVVPAYGAYAALKKAKQSRIKEVLHVLDFFASPFGTKEYLTMNYGVEGTDYTLRGTDPIPTAAAAGDNPQGLLYCGSQQYASLYVAGNRAAVDAQHSYLAKVLPNGVSDPTIGLYSESSQTKGAAVAKMLSNAEGDIIQGRRKLSDWDGIVTQWRQQGGDDMRKDYEHSYAKLHGSH